MIGDSGSAGNKTEVSPTSSDRDRKPSIVVKSKREDSGDVAKGLNAQNIVMLKSEHVHMINQKKK